MIVLGAHCAGPLRDLLGKSMVADVVEDTSRAVLVAAPDRPARFDRILVAVDGSDAAKRAVQATFVMFPSAHIELVHAFTRG